MFFCVVSCGRSTRWDHSGGSWRFVGYLGWSLCEFCLDEFAFGIAATMVCWGMRIGGIRREYNSVISNIILVLFRCRYVCASWHFSELSHIWHLTPNPLVHPYTYVHCMYHRFSTTHVLCSIFSPFIISYVYFASTISLTFVPQTIWFILCHDTVANTFNKNKMNP